MPTPVPPTAPSSPPAPAHPRISLAVQYGVIYLAAQWAMGQIDDALAHGAHLAVPASVNALAALALTVLVVAALEKLGTPVTGVPATIQQFVYEVDTLVHEYHLNSARTAPPPADPVPTPAPASAPAPEAPHVS